MKKTGSMMISTSSSVDGAVEPIYIRGGNAKETADRRLAAIRDLDIEIVPGAALEATAQVYLTTMDITCMAEIAQECPFCKHSTPLRNQEVRIHNHAPAPWAVMVSTAGVNVTATDGSRIPATRATIHCDYNGVRAKVTVIDPHMCALCSNPNPNKEAS